MTLFHHTLWQGTEEQSNRNSAPTVILQHHVVYGRTAKSGPPQIDSYHHMYHRSTVVTAQATVAVAVVNLTTQDHLRDILAETG